MTDNEIIKELQAASEWFTEHGRNTNTAIVGICDRAIDLINRQKAEIEEKAERLRNILPVVAELKTEAVEEFAERLKEHSRKMQSSDFSGEFWDRAVLVEDIDNLVKEFTEGKNNDDTK